MQLQTNSLLALVLGAAIGVAVMSVFADDQNEPTYSAKVPGSVTTPDELKTARLGTLRFFDGMPDEPTVTKVYDNLDFMRAVEVFLNGIPATSIHAILTGLKQAGVPKYGIGITEQLMDARSLFLTPNSTTMYIWSAVDVTDGPLVVEVPPGVLGLVDDAYPVQQGTKPGRTEGKVEINDVVVRVEKLADERTQVRVRVGTFETEDHRRKARLLLQGIANRIP